MKLTKRQLEIIGISLDIIARDGIKNLTIKNIANAMKVSEPAIYRHFASKQEIMMAVIDSFSDASQLVLDGIAMEPESGLAGIEAFVKSRIKMVLDNPPLAKVMFAEEIFMDDPELSGRMLKMMHSHRDCLQQMVLAAQRQGDLRGDIAGDIIFRLIMGPVRLLIKQWGMSGYHFDLRQNGNDLWDALKKTLAAPKQEIINPTEVTI